jgi:flagellar basal-body rod protein FlgF
MTDVLTVAAASMRDDALRVRVLSHNLANVQTPGYRKQIAVGAGFAHHFAHADGAHLPAPVRRDAVVIDPRAGTLKSTGIGADVAVEGAAFIEVAGPSGPLYTRQGSLHVDVQGRLVGEHGFPVNGAGGEIRLANLPFTIGRDGAVRQQDRVIGHIKLVSFVDAGQLTPHGQGLYLQDRARIDEHALASQLRSGYLESSNVNVTEEMVRLTEAVRHFESIHRVVQTHDEMMEKAIRKLGEF